MRSSKKYESILILTALPFESRTILNYHKINFKPKKLTTYRLDESIYLIEAPIGFKLDPSVLNNEVERLSPKLIINFGICGMLDSAITLGSPFRVKRVCHIDAEIGENKLPVIESPFQSASLLTVDEPVLKTKRRDELLSQSGCQLVDKEAYHIAHFCKAQHLPLLIIKIASDFADENSLNVIKEHRAELEQSLTNAYGKMLATLP